MSTVPVQCQCGQIVQISRTPLAWGVRCPSCGASVRGTFQRRSLTGRSDDAPPLDRGIAAQRDLDADSNDAGYSVAAEPGDRSVTAGQEPARTWVPARTGSERQGHGARFEPAGSRRDRSDLLARVQRTTTKLPGPFFTWSALVYPFRYPTWVRLLGLSFMGVLAVGVLAITLFVSWIVIRFQLFLAVFAISSMAMVNVALFSYVIACFVEVIEESAAGEETLEQLVDMSWWEILPRFFQVASAAGISATLAWILSTPLQIWVAHDDSLVRIIQAMIVFQVFPILLLANLSESTVVPLRPLPEVMRRLAGHTAHFMGFQLVAASVTCATVVVFWSIRDWRLLAVVGGPTISTWLLYYGHWLGRLGRQLADTD
jgi:hypothetical protein